MRWFLAGRSTAAAWLSDQNEVSVQALEPRGSLLLVELRYFSSGGFRSSGGRRFHTSQALPGVVVQSHGYCHVPRDASQV
jgi:hypothetical protein